MSQSYLELLVTDRLDIRNGRSVKRKIMDIIKDVCGIQVHTLENINCIENNEKQQQKQ